MNHVEHIQIVYTVHQKTVLVYIFNQDITSDYNQKRFISTKNIVDSLAESYSISF